MQYKWMQFAGSIKNNFNCWKQREEPEAYWGFHRFCINLMTIALLLFSFLWFETALRCFVFSSLWACANIEKSNKTPKRLFIMWLDFIQVTDTILFPNSFTFLFGRRSLHCDRSDHSDSAAFIHLAGNFSEKVRWPSAFTYTSSKTVLLNFLWYLKKITEIFWFFILAAAGCYLALVSPRTVGILWKNIFVTSGASLQILSFSLRS